MEKEPRYIKRYRIWGIITIALVFFLIFIGGLVRSTGSGMGCPDWPKCFGQWVPPTNVSELPVDYKNKFAVAGKAIADFDVFKTWTEYINRLIGVLIGFAVFLTLVFSIPYLKSKPTIFYLSLLSFLLVGFQGWIGSIVVSTDLATYMVTIHMLIALVIVALLIYTVSTSQNLVIECIGLVKPIKHIALFTLLIGLIQIVSGTQVREVVDEVAKRIDNRALWAENLGFTFLFHRSLSWLSLLSSVYMLFLFKNNFTRDNILYKSALALLLVICTQAFSGAALANLGFKSQLQSVHLTLGSFTIGLQIFITIMVFNSLKEKNSGN